MDKVFSVEKDGKLLIVVRDEEPDNPRNWDNLGKMICFHRRYKLGDEHNFKSARDFLEQLVFELHGDKYGTYEALADMSLDELLELVEEKAVILPLYFYEHSLVSISTRSFVGRAQHAECDSCQVGWIYVAYNDVLKEFRAKEMTPELRRKAEKILESEVEVYDLYLRGEVFGYIINDERGNTVDSCFGFYGEDWKKNGLLNHVGEWADLILHLQQ